MEKKVFKSPFVKMVRFDAIDVITTSGGGHSGNNGNHYGQGEEAYQHGNQAGNNGNGRGVKGMTVSPTSLAW